MTDEARVHEIDLLGYVDGLLDDDPALKARVESFLRDRPLEAARVRDYRAQTDALRRTYGPRAQDRVPESLLGVLEAAPTRARRRWPRAAAVVLLTLAAGLGGWAVGQRGHEAAWSAQDFVERTRQNYANAETPPARGGTLVEAAEDEPLAWLTERILPALRVPDLGSLGYSVVDRQIVGGADGRMVRLLYQSADGHSFVLFLMPRWNDRDPALRVHERDDVALVYWLDGPVASAVAARLAPEQTLNIARAVRRAMHNREPLSPVVHPVETTPPLQGADVSPDLVETEPVSSVPPAAGGPAMAN